MANPAAQEAAQSAIDNLVRTNSSVALAESLTGGLVCARLTSIPGASRVVLGGIVAYSTTAKYEILGVPQTTLDAHGAVSAETAREMASAVSRLFSSHIGVATTGVAGPDRQEGKDVGTVFLALAVGTLTQVEELRLEGTRDEIRALTADRALALLATVAENFGSRKSGDGAST